LYILDGGGILYVGNGGDLFGVGFDAAVADDEAE
jgi:hypothetical protein